MFDNLSPEFVFFVITQLITVGIILGTYKTTISFMQQQIKEIKEQAKLDKQELTEEMRKYNNVLSRLAVAENSIRSAHHRMDFYEGK